TNIGTRFYDRKQRPDWHSELLTRDPATMTYRQKQPARLPALDAARAIDDTATRIKTLFLGRDKVGAFLRQTLGPTLLYTARVTPSIAHSIDDVDRVMQWGFGWELGPFETWDAIGVRGVLDALGGAERPPLLCGRDRFRDDGVPPAGPDLQILKSGKDRQRIVR